METHKKYQWKLKGLARGIDPDLAVQELERIEENYGELTDEIILNASEPEDAVLHPLFLWDNDEAAKRYRLSQARNILNNVQLVIVSDGEPRNISVYEVVKKGGVYKHIENFTAQDVIMIRERALKELNALKYKLALYDGFAPVIRSLDEAVQNLFVVEAV